MIYRKLLALTRVDLLWINGRSTFPVSVIL